MLSDDLNSLSTWWADVVDGRTVPTRESLQLFAANLAGATEKARQLESTCIAQAARLTLAAAGPNVVPFARAARDHG